MAGTIIRTLSAPGAANRGMAVTDRCIIVCDDGTDKIYVLDKVTGTLIRTIDSPADNPYSVSWDGRSLWCMPTNGTMQQLDPVTGTLLRIFTHGIVDARGFCFAGKWVFILGMNTDLIYQFEVATGKLIRTISAPTSTGFDVAWDGRALWNTGSTNARTYQIDIVTGTVIQSFANPIGTMLGLDFDGRTLWGLGRSGTIVQMTL